ncbi:phospholipase D zeta 1-like [Miscanthus floridulus]|uniref:phospholipase D zeta 1-like n=1 Tax=Miscanthus floridulus TaxID=154761 RepID=UPI00345A9437
MNLESLPPPAGLRHGHHRYARMPPQEDLEGEAAPTDQERELERRPEVLAASASASLRVPDAARVFDELPRASIVAVSRPDAGDITPMLLSYTIEVHYKQFRWRLYKKASQVLYLHFALKRREFLEEFHEKQEQVSFFLEISFLFTL